MANVQSCRLCAEINSCDSSISFSFSLSLARSFISVAHLGSSVQIDFFPFKLLRNACLSGATRFLSLSPSALSLASAALARRLRQRQIYAIIVNGNGDA